MDAALARAAEKTRALEDAFVSLAGVNL
jgi:hypothetical protein